MTDKTKNQEICECEHDHLFQYVIINGEEVKSYTNICSKKRCPCRKFVPRNHSPESRPFSSLDETNNRTVVEKTRDTQSQKSGLEPVKEVEQIPSDAPRGSLSEKMFYENTDDGFLMFVSEKGNMSSQIVPEDPYLQAKDVRETISRILKKINDNINKHSDENKQEAEKRGPSQFNIHVYKAFEGILQGLGKEVKKIIKSEVGEELSK
ncbi:MAG: hypothetical protein AABY22_22435 [Nanoarchaeota archaeon]